MSHFIIRGSNYTIILIVNKKFHYSNYGCSGQTNYPHSPSKLFFGEATAVKIVLFSLRMNKLTDEKCHVHIICINKYIAIIHF